MNKTRLGVLALGLALAAWCVPGAVRAQDAAAAQANEYFQAQDWAKAAPAYEALAKANPSNGAAWFRLGQARHGLGEYQQALDAYEKARTAGVAPVAIHYRSARAYAKMGNAAQALERLEGLVQGGFANAPLLENDADLAELRAEPRFAAVLLQAQKNARPCDNDPNYRRFDFWVGEWNVTANGQTAGTNRIELIESNCIVFENWTGAGGGTGKSFNFYNNQTGKWNQVWVAGNGSNLFFEGEFRDGNLHYTGTTLRPGGAKTQHKLTFFNLEPGHVRQLWESSTDDGKTWNVVFDGDYARRRATSSGLSARDEGAIRSVLATYTRGWLEGNPEKVMSIFHEDAAILPHHGTEPRVGSAAIRGFWWPPDSPPARVNRMEVTPDEISGAGDLAYVRGHFALAFTMQQDGAERTFSNAGTFLMVLRRNAAGEWRIAQYMWDDPAPQAR